MHRCTRWKTICLLLCGCLLASKPVSADDPTDRSATFASKTVEQWSTILSQQVDGPSDEEKEISRQAASALGLIGPPSASAVEPLTRAIQSPSLEVRDHAVDALGRIGPAAAAAVPTIIAEMDLPPSHINYAPLAAFRREAARSLGRIGPPAKAAVPLLGRALKNEDLGYRVQAALALWRILQQPHAIDFLAAMIDADQPETSYDALMALGQIGPAAQRVLPRVVAALDHPQSDVRRAAADLLVRWGPLVIEPVAGRIQQGSLRWPAPAAYVLGEVSGDLRETVFYREGIDRAEFAAAAQPVLQFAAPALIRLLSDPREPVRQTAQRSLSQMGLLAAPLVTDLLDNQDAAVRWAAAQTLVQIEAFLPPGTVSNESLDALRRNLLNRVVRQMEQDDPDTRAVAFRAFASIDFGDQGRSALPLLRRALKDENLAVRRYAAQALREVDGSD